MEEKNLSLVFFKTSFERFNFLQPAGGERGASKSSNVTPVSIMTESLWMYHQVSSDALEMASLVQTRSELRGDCQKVKTGAEGDYWLLILTIIVISFPELNDIISYHCVRGDSPNIIIHFQIFDLFWLIHCCHIESENLWCISVLWTYILLPVTIFHVRSDGSVLFW